jgi:hypothetical protein
MPNKKAIFVFGRMNPPTVGHRTLINKAIQTGEIMNAEVHVYVTKTQKRETDPLPPNLKKEILNSMYPNMKSKIFMESSIPVIMQKMKNGNYGEVYMMVGSDRLKNFQWVKNKLCVTNVLSGGQRDPTAAGAGGMSATVARRTARQGSVQNFSRCINASRLSPELIQRVYNTIQNPPSPPPKNIKR